MELAFILPHLGPIQLASDFIKSANESKDVDVVGFYEDLTKPVEQTKFSTMSLFHAWQYRGPLVATTIRSAYKFLNFPGPSKKYFYIYDLEWIYLHQKDYRGLSEIYGNKNLKFVCRSEYHKRACESQWDMKVDEVIEEFNIDKFARLLK